MIRKPWLAACLTLWMPGLGQMYAGEIQRAAIVCVLWWITATAAFAITVVLPPRVGAWMPFVLLLAGGAAIMVDAARTARNAPQPFVLQSYNRWYIYLVMPLVFRLPLQSIIKQNFYQTFSIPSLGMAPTALPGDWIYTTRWRGAVTRGSVVVLRHDNEPLLKRVVGIPGDTLAMRNDSLYVNGGYVNEPYATPSYQGADDDGTPTRSTWGPVIVPSRACFVLGDNRGYSRDSRDYGAVPLDSIIRRPIGIYFSRDFSRIGRDIRR